MEIYTYYFICFGYAPSYTKSTDYLFIHSVCVSRRLTGKKTNKYTTALPVPLPMGVFAQNERIIRRRQGIETLYA